jgi:uncharacterized coiled-coil protein SlyX
MTDNIRLPCVRVFGQSESTSYEETVGHIEITPDIARQIVELGGEPRTVNELLTEQANAKPAADPAGDDEYERQQVIAAVHRAAAKISLEEDKIVAGLNDQIAAQAKRIAMLEDECGHLHAQVEDMTPRTLSDRMVKDRDEAFGRADRLAKRIAELEALAHQSSGHEGNLAIDLSKARMERDEAVALLRRVDAEVYEVELDIGGSPRLSATIEAFLARIAAKPSNASNHRAGEAGSGSLPCWADAQSAGGMP